MTAQILIVEDDRQIRNFLQFTLESEGYVPQTAATAQEAMQRLVTGQFDLILLDLGLPDYEGTDVIRKVRSWSDIPIIVVSARDQDSEKVRALDAGADDYLTKPFSATELLARIRVALRHLLRSASAKEQTELTVGELTLDPERRLVFLEGQQVHLSPLEFQLLSLLFRHRGKVLTTQMILKDLYGVSYGTDTQALRALMASLRRKIEKTPARPRYLLTEIGVGYRLSSE